MLRRATRRLLLEHKTDVNAKDESGWIALHWAAKNGYETVVQLLLDHKTDVNAKDESGWISLHWAAQNGHEAVVQHALLRSDSLTTCHS